MLRDFNNNPPANGPRIHMLNLIASAVNATLVLTSSIQSKCLNTVLKNTPTFRLTFGSYLHEYSEEKPSIFLTNSAALNFVYCSKIRTETEKISPLQVFNLVADMYAWVCLIFSIILVSTLVRAFIGRSNVSAVMATLSVLLSFGINGESQALRHNWLLTLWMLMCLVLNTYYSGEITSTVIKPADEYRMTNLKQLADKNYLLFGSTNRDIHSNPSEFKNIVESISGNTSTWSKILASMKVAEVVPAKEEFYKILGNANRNVVYTFWQIAMQIATQAHEYFKRKNVKQHRCYVGKEQILSRPSYLLCTSWNKEIHRSMVVMTENGLWSRWYKEYCLICSSTKVQHRSKIISETKLMEEVQPPDKLEMTDGKIQNVFALWITCLGICLAAFLVENVALCTTKDKT